VVAIRSSPSVASVILGRTIRSSVAITTTPPLGPNVGQIWPRGTGAQGTLNVTAAAELPGFYRSGAATVAAGTFKWYNDSGRTVYLTSVRATVALAPVGASLIVDVNKNGSTIFTTQANRPTIVSGALTSVSVPDVTTWANGDYLTVDIDQVGSTTPGTDLQVQVASV
jgi:hypothetical protein